MNKFSTTSLATALLPLLITLGCDDSGTSSVEHDESSSSGNSEDFASEIDPDDTTGTTDTSDADTSGSRPGTGASGGESSPDPDSASASDIEDEEPWPEPFCGDAQLDAGEVCDEGAANTSSGACKQDCTLARCGDGEINIGIEACDDGDAGNVLAVGACAPDCSRVIEQRTIRLGEMIDSGGDLGPQPVAFVDSRCEPGYRAMFAHPGVRVASTIPLYSVGALDWVIEPFTAYVNTAGDSLWITGSIPLLGVRNGLQHDLNAAVSPQNTVAVTMPVVTGLTKEWLTNDKDTCAGWSSDTAAYNVKVGRPDRHDQLLDTGTPVRGDQPLWVYCVEQ